MNGERWEDLSTTPPDQEWESLSKAPPEPPSALETAAPTMFERFTTPTTGVRQAIDLAKGVGTGALETVKGIPAFLSSVMGAPKQVSEDVKALVSSPETALPQFAERAGRFAWQMVPFAKTLSGLLRGEVPTATQIGEEAGGLATAVAIPRVVGGATKRAVRAGVKELPGAGVELQALAIPQAEALSQRLAPGMPAVRQAYRGVGEMGNPTLDMGPMRRIAQDIIAHESTASRPNAELLRQAKRIMDSSVEGWSWETATSEVRRIGEQMREIKKVRGEVPKEVTDLYGALRDSVEAAKPSEIVRPAQAAQPATATSPFAAHLAGKEYRGPQPARPAVVKAGTPTSDTLAQTEAWTQAQRMARRQFASEELADRINTAVGVSGEAFSSFSVNKVLKWIDQQERGGRLGHPDTKARRFVESFGPGELADIKGTLKEISGNMAALPSMRGQPVGSAQRFLHYGLGQVVGGATGHPYLGGPSAIVIGEGISRLMQTSGGRAFIRRAIRIDPTVGPLFTALVYGGLRGSRGAQE